jgi:hypothetical protein
LGQACNVQFVTLGNLVMLWIAHGAPTPSRYRSLIPVCRSLIVGAALKLFLDESIPIGGHP